MNLENIIFIGLIGLGIVLAKLPLISRPFDWMETFFHELSHGLAATVTFGWMKRIKLNWDGSGYCVTRGGLRIPVLLAGYMGAVIAGMAIYLVGWEIGNGTLTSIDQMYVLRILIGLFAFFYVLLHLSGYVWLDKAFAWPDIWQDILKRQYITVGVTALVLLVPLAVTSTKGWIKRLGARNWQRLHKSVYLIGVLAVVHFIMMRKGFQIEPLVYAAILAGLLLFRSQTIFRKIRA